MEWRAEITKEQAKKLLMEREREVIESFKSGREGIRTRTSIVSVVQTETNGECLRDIEMAWKRIEKNTFGICRICELPIPGERLKAIPEADLCCSCKKALGSFVYRKALIFA